MFFTASERLAEATADLGDLAGRLDRFLEPANESWVINQDQVASVLDTDRDRAAYLLRVAARPDIELLLAETYLRCTACDNLMPISTVDEARENEERVECTQCGRPMTGDEPEETVYRLAPGAAGEARQRAARPERNVVILTALELELRAVHKHLREVAPNVHPAGTVYHIGRFETEHAVWRVGTVAVGAGNPGAAAEAERAVTHFVPEAALFVGIAGGIKDVALGDVVAASEVYLYHAGKALEEFKPRPEVFRSAYALVSQARAAALQGSWRARIACESDSEPDALVEPMAAGEQVVASQESATYQFIRDHYGRAVAVEMEGAGFLRAAYANQDVRALVVRGISDLLDNKEEADQAGWQPWAAAHAAAFAFEVLANLP